MIQACLDIHYMFVDIWKTFVVVVEKWKMKKELYVQEQQTINARSLCGVLFSEKWLISKVKYFSPQRRWSVKNLKEKILCRKVLLEK